MVDTRTIDLLSLVGQDTLLRKVAATEGGEWAGPCPVCGGADRFRVQPHRRPKGRAFCRQCGFAGDAISYVMWVRGLDFREACAWLRLELPKRQSPSRAPADRSPGPEPAIQTDPQAATAPEWQSAACAFCQEREDILWNEQGRGALQYLMGERHLSTVTIAAAALGFNPTAYQGQWGVVEVRLPRGIVIPWYFDYFYWNLRIRRPNKDLTAAHPHKYISAKGAINGLYRFQTVQPGWSVVLVEGEFDALLLRQIAADHQIPVAVVATGSVSGARRMDWIIRLALASQVYVAFDRETEAQKIDSTERAANWWITALKPKAHRLLPTRHDITDMVSEGDDVAVWLARALDT